MNQKSKFFAALDKAVEFHKELIERHKEELWNDFQGENADEENATGTFTFNIGFRDSIKPIENDVKVRSGIRWNIAKKDDAEGVVSDQPDMFESRSEVGDASAPEPDKGTKKRGKK